MGDATAGESVANDTRLPLGVERQQRRDRRRRRDGGPGRERAESGGFDGLGHGRAATERDRVPNGLRGAGNRQQWVAVAAPARRGEQDAHGAFLVRRPAGLTLRS